MAGSSPVVTGTDALARLEAWCAEASPEEGRFVLGDERTLTHCLPELLAQVPALRDAETLQLRSGERSKDLEVCRALWTRLAERAADRQAVLVDLGGGVVSDVGGFTAANYKRGIRFVNVPTTVMGMVDAAIGGKTAIDVNGVKNLVGAFADPEAVYVHPPFLRTLGKREVLSGVAEMIKHGLVRDAAHWDQVRRAPLHDLDALAPLIHRSAAIKAAVVSADPREQGERKLLNFGHTIGHALEAFAMEGTDRPLLHGEAVAIGMVCAGWLSWRMGRLDQELVHAVVGQLLGLYPAFALRSTDHHRILELMRNDKKNNGPGFRFTLLTGIGCAVTDVPVDATQVIEALDHYHAMAHDPRRRHHPQA